MNEMAHGPTAEPLLFLVDDSTSPFWHGCLLWHANAWSSFGVCTVSPAARGGRAGRVSFRDDALNQIRRQLINGSCYVVTDANFAGPGLQVQTREDGGLWVLEQLRRSEQLIRGVVVSTDPPAPVTDGRIWIIRGDLFDPVVVGAVRRYLEKGEKDRALDASGFARYSHVIHSAAGYAALLRLEAASFPDHRDDVLESSGGADGYLLRLSKEIDMWVGTLGTDSPKVVSAVKDLKDLVGKAVSAAASLEQKSLLEIGASLEKFLELLRQERESTR